MKNFGIVVDPRMIAINFCDESTAVLPQIFSAELSGPSEIQREIMFNHSMNDTSLLKLKRAPRASANGFSARIAVIDG